MTARRRRIWSPRIVGVAVVALLLAGAAGVFVGLRAPWATKHARVKEGIAMRANSDNGLVLFDAEDGTRLALYVEGLWWESGGSEGQGDPPCLRTPGKKSPVEVGYLWIAGPAGGARPEALWGSCL